MDNNTTIISLITSVVGGSVSVLRISGPEAIDISSRVFTGNNISQSPGGYFYHGKIVKDTKVIDEVLISIFRNPNSYTGEDVVEISSHSNPIIVKNIIDLFMELGCRMAEPGEFTKRAFLNGKIDLIQAEAIADLIAAKSRKAIDNSLKQMEGALSKKLNTIKSNLLNTASLLELDIDFSEEDLVIISHDKISKQVKDIIIELEELIKSYENSRTLNKGVEVLLSGKPNVGKSSLMNAILERERVIVSELPGTTRDFVHEDIMIEETVIRFIDTAGIHMTDDSVEASGVEKARNLFKESDILLLVVDTSKPFDQDDYNLVRSSKTFFKEKTFIIANKTDLRKEKSSEEFLNDCQFPVIYISAKTKSNISLLKYKIIEYIKTHTNTLDEELIITNQRQLLALKHTHKTLVELNNSVEENMGFEFLSIDIRTAIDYLSEISGEITTDHILNNIFSNFCIGK